MNIPAVATKSRDRKGSLVLVDLSVMEEAKRFESFGEIGALQPLEAPRGPLLAVGTKEYGLILIDVVSMEVVRRFDMF